MTDIKIEQPIDYCTQKSLADYYIRFKVNRIIDENQILKFLSYSCVSYSLFFTLEPQNAIWT